MEDGTKGFVSVSVYVCEREIKEERCVTDYTPQQVSGSIKIIVLYTVYKLWSLILLLTNCDNGQEVE